MPEKVLHTSFLNITMVIFEILHLGNCVLTPASSPTFNAILELSFSNGFQSWHCTQNLIIRLVNLVLCTYVDNTVQTTG